MAELGWTTSEVKQERLQNLMTQGYMMAVELKTPRDTGFHIPRSGGMIRRGMHGVLRVGI
jgi:hypothetical protein